MFDSDDGSISPITLCRNIYMTTVLEGLTVQLEYLDCLVLG